MGFSAGAMVSNAGVALVSASNGIKAAHSAVSVFKTSRFGKVVIRRLTRSRLSDDLNEVVVVSETASVDKRRIITSPMMRKSAISTIRKEK